MSKIILVVDDSNVLRRLTVYFLEKAGYEVVQAKNGQDAINKAKERTVDLVLIEQKMPNMDGLTLTKHLRELAAFQSVHILMMTGKSSIEMKDACKLAGVNRLLTKPFEYDYLIAVVKRLLDAKNIGLEMNATINMNGR